MSVNTGFISSIKISNDSFKNIEESLSKKVIDFVPSIKFMAIREVQRVIFVMIHLDIETLIPL